MRPPRRVAIVQSSYVPWKGYFDLVNLADVFVLLDDVQYTRSDWRNRNRIKTADGLRWLTIPVSVKGRFGQRIDETRIADSRWRKRHWRSLEQAYARAPWFEQQRDRFRALYLDSTEEALSTVNRRFIEAICAALGITTSVTSSTEYGVQVAADPSDRVAALVAAVGGSEYVSGPRARAYLRLEPFHVRGVTVSYIDYDGYPEYHQLHGPFEHQVSVLDLLFNEGPDAWRYMKSFTAEPPLVAAGP